MVSPTFSMSLVRTHFWKLTARFTGAGSSPMNHGLNGSMPAMVSNTDGSAGMSDAEGKRR